MNDGTEDSAVATVTILISNVQDAPVADAQTDVPVVEETPTAITLTGSDADDDELSFTVIDGPTKGALSGTAPNLTYTPALNETGADSFTFKVNDGTEDSAVATVTILISNVQDAPVADAQTDVPAVEETPTAITLTGSDADDDELSFTVIDGPTKGALSGTAPNLTYTPALNETGADSFTFKVNDGTEDSAVATVTILISNVQDAPVADAQTDVPVVEETPTAITLTGSDADDDELSFTVIDGPTKGALSGTAPNLTYTPALNETGADSFTFKVNDGTEDSAVATVTILISNVQDAPVADAQTDVPVVEETPTAITLTGSDADDDELSFTVIDGPTKGALSGTAPNLTYTPALNETGADSFTFKVNDGTEDSAVATVTILISNVQDAPVADDQPSVSVDENSSVAITLTGSDADGDSLTFTVTVPPSNGTLTGTLPDLTYTPTTGYDGPDSFEFIANDGIEDSDPATVSITVNNVVGPGFVEWLDENSIPNTPSTTDSDGDKITNAVEYVIGGDPVLTNDNGLLPTRSMVTADPDGDETSSLYQLFTYRRTDRSNEDPLVTMFVEWSVNLATWSNADETAGVVTLEDNDYFGEGVDRVRVYLPTSLSGGGMLFSRLAVFIAYTPANQPPAAAAQSVTVDEDGSLPIVLTGTDPESKPLTFNVLTQPSHGTLGGSAPNLTYTPAANYNGADSFTFEVNDGTLASAPATVSISVTPLAEFNQWMGLFGLTDGSGVDSDGDGLGNGVEWVLGGNPATGGDLALQPTLEMVTADPDGDETSSDYLLFTYRRTDQANEDASTTIQVGWSPGLAGPWQPAGETAGVIVLEEDEAAGAGVDLVKVYIPRSLSPDGKLFARLGVTVDVAAP